MAKNNEDDNLWKILITTIILLFLLMGTALSQNSIVSPQNALGQAIISNEYNMSNDYLSSLRTYNYLISNNELSSINSSLFVTSQTLASFLDIELEIIDKWDIMAEKIIQCESQNQMVWGDHNYYENGVNIKSYGVAQFQERTFNWLKELANKPKLDFYSRQDQVWLLNWALENGYSYLWTCSKLI
jgi:hypothetical protein